VQFKIEMVFHKGKNIPYCKEVKMRKAFWMVVVVVSLVALVFGCAPAPAEKAPAAEEPTPTQGEPIKIAITGPMTHSSGEQIWWNCTIAAEEINEAGGVSVGGVKRPLELVKVDTNELTSVPDAALAIERAITVNKVDFIVGSWNTEPVLAMQDVAMDYKKIFITEGAGTPMADRVKEDYERYKYWFRAYYSSKEAVPYYYCAIPQFADLVREELGIETPKVAVMMDKAEWVEPMVKAADYFITEAGCENIGVWRPSTTATDVSAELLAIKDAGAQIIFHIMYGPSSMVVAKQWDELQIPAALVGCNGEAPYDTFMESTHGLGNYLATLAGSSEPVAVTEKTIPFFDKFTQKYGEKPQTVWCFFYDAIYRLAEAIERADTLDADALVVELEKTDYIGVMGREVWYGPETDDAHGVRMGPEYVITTGAQYQDGELFIIWPPADGSWHGVSFPGTVEAELPPWMVEYWKGK